MAEPYYSQLRQTIESLHIPKVTLERKHFFSGAALYANGRICALLGPAGLAVKLPEDQRLMLIQDGRGTEFRYFPHGPVKREYVLLAVQFSSEELALNEVLGESVGYVLAAPD